MWWAVSAGHHQDEKEALFRVWLLWSGKLQPVSWIDQWFWLPDMQKMTKKGSHLPRSDPFPFLALAASSLSGQSGPLYMKPSYSPESQCRLLLPHGLANRNLSSLRNGPGAQDSRGNVSRAKLWVMLESKESGCWNQESNGIKSVKWAEAKKRDNEIQKDCQAKADRSCAEVQGVEQHWKLGDECREEWGPTVHQLLFLILGANVLAKVVF